MAFVSYLVSPAEVSPRYGLDHEFSIDSEEFLATITGAIGGADARRQSRRRAQQRRRVLSGDARGDCARAGLDHHRGLHLLGRQHRTPVRAGAGAKAREGIPVKILLDAVGSATIGTEILETLEKGGCQLAWYNRIHWYTSVSSTIARIASRSSSTAVSGSPAVRASPTCGWSRTVARALARYDDPHRRSLGDATADRVCAELAEDNRRAALRCDVLSGTRASEVTFAVQTVMSSPEAGASSVRLMHYLPIVCARRSIYISNPVLHPRSDGHRHARRGAGGAAWMSGSWSPPGTMTTGWLGRTRVRLYGPLLRAGIQILEYNKTFCTRRRWSSMVSG